MGTWYVVEADVRFKDGTGEQFCKAVNWKLDELINTQNVRVDFGDADFNDPFELFGIICPNAKEHGDGDWCSSFDASYGWEGVLWECFEAARPTLAEGSRIEVWGEDHWSVEV